MTVNAAFTNQTTNGVSSGYELDGSSRFVVEIQGDSVMDGADVQIEACSADTSAKYSPLDHFPIRSPICVVGELAIGMFVRLRVIESGPSTSINAKIVT